MMSQADLAVVLLFKSPFSGRGSPLFNLDVQCASYLHSAFRIYPDKPE